MQSYRIIFHIDMNCFFASVETAENEELRGKPVVVSRIDALRKGIILSPNYEARKYGIKTTMQVRDALILCKDLIIVEPNMDLYQKYSNAFFDYFRTITPFVEPASIDEGYLDVTKVCEKKNALDLAKEMQDYLYKNLKLPCSIGIAPNKFLAKMASDMKKPLGITILRKREIDKYLWILPIEDMIGIGKKTAPKLKEIGINKIGDLANFNNIDIIKKLLGNTYAEQLIEKANGNDSSEVNYETFDDLSSISNSYTFDYNIGNEEIILTTLKVLTNTVCNRLKQRNLKAKNIGLQLKYDDFKLINRSSLTKKITNDETEIYSLVKDLFYSNYEDNKDVRLVGVFTNRLVEAEDDVIQYSLFDDLNAIEKDNKVDQLLNNIKSKFGIESIARGYKKEK